MLRRVGVLVAAVVSVLMLAAGVGWAEPVRAGCAAVAKPGAGMFELRPARGGFDLVRVAGMNPGACLREPVNSLAVSVTWQPGWRGEPGRWVYRYGREGVETVGFFESSSGWFFDGRDVVWRASTLQRP